MAYLCCTKKIVDLLGITPVPSLPSDDTTVLGPWYTNLFFVERKKCLIFTNAKTLFSFVVINQTKKDLEHIGDIFRRELLKRLQAELIGDEAIPRIMRDCEKVTLCKTSDRKTLGSMNEFVFHFNVHCVMEEGLANLDVDKFNTLVAGTIMKLNGKYIRPREMLKEVIKAIQ